MAFVCPPKEECETIALISSSIKNALQEIDNQMQVGVKPICVPCCVPLCEYPPAEPKNDRPNKKIELPKVMVCYKERCAKGKDKQNGTQHEKGVIRLQQSKSRELRASILYTGCQCEKRDGLQDDCPRTGCHGSPECLTRPPTCGPSEFCDGKHLGKKNKFGYLHKNGSGTHNGTDETAESKIKAAKYKCFAATVEQPVIIPITSTDPCCPCPPCR